MALNKIETNLLILGAGWSGLLTADFLSDTKKDIVILEKEPEAGGLARSFNFKGYKFDIGGHRLCFRNPENIDYLKSIINKEQLLELRTKAKILFENKYIDYPICFNSLLKFDKKLLLRILIEMLCSKAKCKDDNLEDWILSNYGKAFYNIYFREYTEKVWGKSCRDLSPSWADKRIGKNDITKLIKRVLLKQGIKDESLFFYYPRFGMEGLVSSLESRVKNSSIIYRGVELKNFGSAARKLNSLTFIFNNQHYQVNFKQVVSTIPLQELLISLSTNTQQVLQEIKNGLVYRSLILLALIIGKESATNWHWCYFPDREVFFSRLHEPKRWSKDMALEESTLLCLEIFCDYNDDIWNMKEEVLIEKSVTSLLRTNIIEDRLTIRDYSVHRIKYAYPVHYKSYGVSLNRIDNYLHSYSNLVITGRSGTHSYFDMEECLNDIRDKIKYL